MNKKQTSRIPFYLCIIFIILLLAFCSTAPEVKEPEPEPEPIVETNTPVEEPVQEVAEETKVETMVTESVEEIDPIEKFQPELDKMTYSEFDYKQIRPKKKFRLAWIEQHLSRLKEIAEQIPDDYIINLKGHDARGSKKNWPKTVSRYNMGHLRSRYLHILLKANDLPMDKFIFSSAADEEPIEGIKHSDPRNRRVTLHIEKKTDA